LPIGVADTLIILTLLVQSVFQITIIISVQVITLHIMAVLNWILMTWLVHMITIPSQPLLYFLQEMICIPQISGLKQKGTQLL